MRKETEKKLWSKPEMTVLVRSKPEEQVLRVCKTGGWTGPESLQNNCQRGTDARRCDRQAPS